MTCIDYLVTKLAEEISDNCYSSDTEYIASIITAHVEPLIALLRKSKCEHRFCSIMNNANLAGHCTCRTYEWTLRVNIILTGLAAKSDALGRPRSDDHKPDQG